MDQHREFRSKDEQPLPDPSTISSPDRKKGVRQGHLSPDVREAAAATRKRGACEKCRRLKGRCSHTTVKSESGSSTGAAAIKRWECHECYADNDINNEACQNMDCEHGRCEKCCGLDANSKRVGKS